MTLAWLKPLFQFLHELVRHLIPAMRKWWLESRAAKSLAAKRKRNRDAVYGVPDDSAGQRSTPDSAPAVPGNESSGT